jgi:hypothetical protein
MSSNESPKLPTKIVAFPSLYCNLNQLPTCTSLSQVEIYPNHIHGAASADKVTDIPLPFDNNPNMFFFS